MKHCIVKQVASALVRSFPVAAAFVVPKVAFAQDRWIPPDFYATVGSKGIIVDLPAQAAIDGVMSWQDGMAPMRTTFTDIGHVTAADIEVREGNLGDGDLAYTVPYFDPVTGDLWGGEITFDVGNIWDCWNDVNSQCWDYATFADLIYAIAAHEGGHALGLDDDYNNQNSIMYYMMQNTFWTPDQDDFDSLYNYYAPYYCVHFDEIDPFCSA